MEEEKKVFLALETKIVDALKQVYDPDIPVNIYELGLIYNIKVEKFSEVYIEMTLTNPNCPVAGDIIKEIRQKVGEIEGIKEVYVKLTFDPPWTQDRMTDAAKLEAGLL